MKAHSFYLMVAMILLCAMAYRSNQQAIAINDLNQRLEKSEVVSQIKASDPDARLQVSDDLVDKWDAEIAKARRDWILMHVDQMPDIEGLKCVRVTYDNAIVETTSPEEIRRMNGRMERPENPWRGLVLSPGAVKGIQRIDFVFNDQ